MFRIFIFISLYWMSIYFEGEQNGMDVKLLTGSDLAKFSKLCDEDCLTQVLDAAGGFREGCFGIGILNKDGIGRALLLAVSKTDRSCQLVRFLYHEELYPQDGETLLRMAGTYARLQGIEKIECEYIESEGEEVLQSCGWSEPVTEQIVYRIPADHMKSLCVESEAFEGKILPFLKISPEAWVQFTKDDVNGQNNYHNVYEASLDLSFGAMVDDCLVGYLLCREEERCLDVPAFEAKSEYPQLLGIFLNQLWKKTRDKNQIVHALQLYSYDDVGDQIMNELLGHTPYQRIVWKKCVWSI